jgi:hypothetical protein
MAENANEMSQDQPENLVRERIIDLPYPIVDSFVAHGNISELVDRFGYSMQRQQTSSGSANYIFSSRANKRRVTLAVLTLRMVSDPRTHLKLEIKPQFYSQQHSLIARTLFANLLSLLSAKLQTDQAEMARLAEQQKHAPISRDVGLEDFLAAWRHLEQRSIGRPPANDNEWVRQEIQRGRDPKDIREEYLQRQKIDPNNRDAVRLARDRFRKIVERTKRN